MRPSEHPIPHHRVVLRLLHLHTLESMSPAPGAALHTSRLVSHRFASSAAVPVPAEDQSGFLLDAVRPGLLCCGIKNLAQAACTRPVMWISVSSSKVAHGYSFMPAPTVTCALPHSEEHSVQACCSGRPSLSHSLLSASTACRRPFWGGLLAAAGPGLLGCGSQHCAPAGHPRAVPASCAASRAAGKDEGGCC